MKRVKKWYGITSRNALYFSRVRSGTRIAHGNLLGKKNAEIFIGPTVEGSDKEYVKVLCGDVDRRKPSFV